MKDIYVWKCLRKALAEYCERNRKKESQVINTALFEFLRSKGCMSSVSEFQNLKEAGK